MSTLLPNLKSLTPKQAGKFYRAIMDKYSSREWFGAISKHTGQPMHQNHAKNPQPIWANGARRLKSNGPKRSVAHLAGGATNAVFLVNRPDADVYLLVDDLDCEKDAPDGPARALALSGRIHADLGGRSLMSPSRNGRGRYNLMKVRRSASESLEEFTRKLNALNKAARLKYGHKRDNDGVGFDAVKGSPWHTSPNPKYNPEDAHGTFEFATLYQHDRIEAPDWLNDTSEIYRWHRTHYRQFQRIECLEPTLHNSGVLVTQPLFGIRHDPDGGEARWNEFFKWEADASNVIESSELWSLFGVTDDLKVKTAKVKSPKVKAARSKVQQAGDAWEMLTSDDKLSSMNGAAVLAIQKNGIDTSVEDVLELYRKHGAATDDVDTHLRIARATESLCHFLATFDKSKRGLIFTEKDLQAERRYLSGHPIQKLLPLVNRECNSHLTPGRLPLYRLILSKLVLTEANAVGVAKVDGFLRHFNICLNGTELKAIFTLFERAKLFVCLKRKYQFFPLSKGEKAEGADKSEGFSRMWGFAPGADLPAFTLKHVPHILTARQRGRYLAPGQSAPVSGAANVPQPTPPLPVPSFQNLLFVVDLSGGLGRVSHERVAVTKSGRFGEFGRK